MSILPPDVRLPVNINRGHGCPANTATIFTATHFEGSYTSRECNNTVRAITLDKTG
jgi:hypothetical protein